MTNDPKKEKRFALRGTRIPFDEEFETHQSIADHLWPTTIEIIKTDGHHVPTLVFFDSQSMNVISLSPIFDNKDNAAEFIHRIVSNTDVYAIALIVESWMYRAQPGDDISNMPAPSQHPDRVEVMYLVVEMRNVSGHFARQATINRDDKNQITGLSDYTDNLMEKAAGRFSNFFTRGNA